MDDLEQARTTWIKERPRYDELVVFLEDQIKKIIRDPRVQVYGRAKEIDSLLKKLIRKPKKTYRSLRDKAGVRVVVQFDDELDIFGKIIESRFPNFRKEDKRTALFKKKQIGYQGIHYDIKLDKTEVEGVKFKNMWAEIQLRTMAQHLWSDMSHELGYKSELSISDLNSRRLLRLSALVELADDEFLKVRDEIRQMPEFETFKILRFLEKRFYEFAAVNYDKELSVNTIDKLKSIYAENGMLAGEEQFEKFCKNNNKRLLHIFDDNRNAPVRPIFLYQPESLMIFQLLDLNKFTLREKWEEIYPFKELEQLATKWGKPYQS